jgi:hypothetical protein
MISLRAVLESKTIVQALTSSIRGLLTINIDPVKLQGLKQAVYVMQCIVRNDTEGDIVKTLGGDQQLFDMWKSFLQHNGWMSRTKQGWEMTAKGELWRTHETEL